MVYYRRLRMAALIVAIVGSFDLAAAPDDPWEGGQWGPVIPWPHVAVSGANLPDGRILTWSGSERDTWPQTEQTYSGTWNPETGEFIEIFHDGHNMFCAHLAMTEDGRVFVNGGRNRTNSPWTSLFDFRDNSWVQVQNMPSGGRWYPTTLQLPDGDMFTAMGTATNQRNPERWDPTKGWQLQNGIDFNAMVLDDYYSSGTHAESLWWPLLHLAPNGKIFHSGPTPQMHWINFSRNGSYEALGSEFTDWYPKHGTTIAYDEGKLLTAGGWITGINKISSNKAYTVDLNGPAPVIAPAQPMIHARKFHNGVMLPTGEVLVIGGNTSGDKRGDRGAILATEIWNPVTGQWREGASMTVPRNYHSIALLLNDGRVLAAGGGYNANILENNHQDGQVYSPPYLFDSDGSLASRPAIVDAPGIVDVGDTFEVTTSDSIAYFSLIKLSSTTHGVNTDVRFLKPAFIATGADSYRVTLHSNPNVATPGYWMLFAVNSDGVPSEAHVIRITTIDTRFDNIALIGTVSQSSTFVGANDLDADNAIDGDLTGTEESGSLARTQEENNPWWEIDLGRMFDLDRIRIWNRADCCSGSLSGFYVLVSDEAFSSQDLESTRNQLGVGEIYHPGPAEVQTDLTVGRTGRYVRVQLSGQDSLQLAEVQIFGEAVPTPVLMENGTAENVGDAWQSVALSKTYQDMVVIASAQYDGAALPAVVRVRNATGNQFELRVQNPSDSPLSGYTVHYLVVEAGLYESGSFKMEAVKFESTVTDEKNSWVGEARSYQQTYVNPVVVGQVMSENDPTWSVFWASDGTAKNPPSSISLSVGKHVAQDTNTARANETLGYLVIETGAGVVDGITYEAGVGADSVEGLLQTPPYLYPLQSELDLAVVSSAGMDGADGSWPVLYGASPLANAQLALGVDEDQISDTERTHTTEQVAYFALSQTEPAVLSIDPLDVTPEQSGSTVTYTASATGPGILQYSWNFGDNTGNTPFTSINTITHAYGVPGRYAVTLTVRDGEGGEVLETFTQIVHAPLTNGRPKASSTVMEYASQREVWNVNPDNDSVTVIDATGPSVVAEIPVEDKPRSLALAPDGRVWVVNKASATLSIIDPVNLDVVQTIDLPTASQPHGLVIDSTSAYVALEATGEVVKLNAASGQELARASVGDRPRHLSLDADSTRLYVSRFITPPLPGEETASPIVDDGVDLYGGEVLVLDAATLDILSTIVLRHSDRVVSEHTGPGVPNYLGPAVISPDGLSAWVPSKQDNILAGALRGGQGMTFDQTARAVTSMIDIGAGVENFPFRVDHDNASVASAAAVGPFGMHLFTALEGNRQVAVTDIHTATEIDRFDVGRAPQGLAVSADGATLFVHNFMDRTIGLYDIAALTSGKAVEVSEIATLATVINESLPANVLAGKQFFFDARDDRLAALDYLSCASCHNDGGQDGRVWDFTGLGEGLRNTISLDGRAGTAHGSLHWSANFDEVQDFEALIRNLAFGTGLMDDADFFSGTRSEPLGDPKAGVSPDLDALASYVASLNHTPASPYRDPDGTLSAQAELGALVFENAGCATCHVAPKLTDSTDGSGLHDVGTLKYSSGDRLGDILLGIDTPTLLGSWYTAPYLHDGSAGTLGEAIEAHHDVILTADELSQVTAFIRELNAGGEPTQDSGPKLEGGIIFDVGSTWQQVTLSRSYDDMVVIASPQYDDTAFPAITRVRNAEGDRFELKVQNPGGTVLGGYTVHYTVVEAGVYTEAEHGVKMEAVKATSAVTARRGRWAGERRDYLQSYTNPVVVGQVMTDNDVQWSVFWATNGTGSEPPSSASLYAGKHVGEDVSAVRSPETIGYLVIEAGVGTVDGLNYEAGVGADTVRGLVEAAPYNYMLQTPIGVAVVSSAGMKGIDGGWPVVYGADPPAGTQLGLGYDEDQIRDSERNHSTEQASYFVLQ